MWSGRGYSAAAVAAAVVIASAMVSTMERDATRAVLILSVTKKKKDPQTYGP